MDLNVAGGAYLHISQDANFQRCVNMFTVGTGGGGRGGTEGKQGQVLLPTTGLTLLVDLITGNCRGMKTVGAYTYVVSGNSVYRLSIHATNLVATTVGLGNLTTFTGEVNISANPTQIIFVDGTTSAYTYTLSTGAFSVISDSDFPAADYVTFLNGYTIVNVANTGKFQVSTLNDSRAWDATDIATAESSTDNILGFGVAKGELWIFGSTSTEIWYDAANASGMPLSPRTGLELQIGCGAAASITQLDGLLIWLDNRGFIVQSDIAPFVRNNNSGYELKIISTESITSQILSYPAISDAIGMAYNDRGYLMYQITFPSARKTWVYNYTTKLWHERAYFSGVSSQEHFGQYYAQSGTLHLMAGQRDGKVYLSSNLYYDDAGSTIQRIRTTAPQNKETSLMGIDCLELRMETGNVPGGAVTPLISLRYSNDGGHSWSDELIRDMGASGEYAKSIRWNRLGSAREWAFEFLVTAQVPFSIISASVDFEEDK